MKKGMFKLCRANAIEKMTKQRTKDLVYHELKNFLKNSKNVKIKIKNLKVRK